MSIETDTEVLAGPAAEPVEERRPTGSRVRRAAMRPRRALVKVHRWGSVGLLAWLIVVSLTGAWLVSHDAIESWLNPGRFATTSGDIGPQAASKSATGHFPEKASVYGVAMPRNGRGVYQVGAEIPLGGEEYRYEVAYVDPGSGRVNAVRDEEAGFSWWMYRGHMYLWQDHGIFGVFDPETGWCRVNASGSEPGGVKGVVCDVVPDGMDMVAWFGVGFIIILFTGFYLWYWPGVRRWATALVLQRKRGPFAFNLSLHKVIGFVVWIPLTVVAFTGIVFSFPNLKNWYQNVSPAERGMELWIAPDDALESSKANGRDAIGLDEFVDVMEREFPTRAVQYVMPPADKKGTYTAWVTRGFDPWTREAGAGNVYVVVDQYNGKILYDGTPEEGNTFDQLWDDWSFPVHAGDFGGTATRVVWTVLGLTPIALGATGVTMYVIRLQKRRRRREVSDVGAG